MNKLTPIFIAGAMAISASIASSLSMNRNIITRLRAEVAPGMSMLHTRSRAQPESVVTRRTRSPTRWREWKISDSSCLSPSRDWRKKGRWSASAWRCSRR